MLTKAFLDERLVPELESGTVQYFDHIRRYLYAQSFVGGRTVLDVACGTGYGSEMLLRAGARRVMGIDISPEALGYVARCWGKPSSTCAFVQGNAMGLPVASASADVLVSFETLEHIPEPKRFLEEARRVLKSGGTLILSVPNRAAASPGSDTPYSPYHTFEPTLLEFRTLLQETGWTIQSMQGITHSARLAALVRPAHAVWSPTGPAVAWAAYVRLWVRAALPPGIFDWLARRRGIPPIDIADSILTDQASAESSYFVARCTPA